MHYAVDQTLFRFMLLIYSHYVKHVIIISQGVQCILFQPKVVKAVKSEGVSVFGLMSGSVQA